MMAITIKSARLRLVHKYRGGRVRFGAAGLRLTTTPIVIATKSSVDLCIVKKVSVCVLLRHDVCKFASSRTRWPLLP